ncbi:MAG: hypothetical protein PHH12_00905 [Candidatus Shapirobacteria bacterium]|jgi:hypothetical protein|nr:hypothetical protein [Candidatus Shapirobacteria bacterium]
MLDNESPRDELKDLENKTLGSIIVVRNFIIENNIPKRQEIENYFNTMIQHIRTKKLNKTTLISIRRSFDLIDQEFFRLEAKK